MPETNWMNKLTPDERIANGRIRLKPAVSTSNNPERRLQALKKSDVINCVERSRPDEQNKR
jgi:hypothetical protein